MKNEEKFIKQWEKERRNGKKKYMIMCAIKVIIASTCGGVIGWFACGKAISLYIFIRFLAVVCGIITGNLIGTYFSWDSKEEKYNRLISDRLLK